jgi:hypothetical protein
MCEDGSVIIIIILMGLQSEEKCDALLQHKPYGNGKL